MKKSMLGALVAAVPFAVEAQAEYAPRNLRAVVVGETGVTASPPPTV